ncbi:NAD-glutamate dehydrogenase [Psychrobacter sp. HD31]|uniref:NAD-glutamate dehydrogenase n=1 Tax=Psychrobacter sp. HD31 TaxID=3112003 RepID=UPI003DA61F82
MPKITYSIDKKRIEKISQLASGYVAENQQLLSQFVQVYYQEMYAETAQKYSDEDLAGMALHHFTLLMEYDAKKPQIAVINPTVEEHHFHSNASIVQMVAYDRPFLVDTMLMTLEEAGINVHRVHNTIMAVNRDTGKVPGKVIGIGSADSSDRKHMSIIHCEIDSQATDKLREVGHILFDKVELLDAINSDWQAMRDRLELAQSVVVKHMPEDFYSRAAVNDFLSWILDDHFIFLGYREYTIEQNDNDIEMYTVGGSGLGVLRTDDEHIKSESFEQLPNELKHQVTGSRSLLLSKSNHVSPVHRAGHMDFLGIHKFDETGKLVGEYRFIGLLTSQAYQLRVQQIPLLRENANKLLAMANLPKDGHAYQKMMNIINELPRDDLFQASAEELYPIVRGISQLQDKTSLRLFTRMDSYQRFVSCLAYIPRDKFNTRLRKKVQEKLVEAYGGLSAGFTTKFDDTNHACVSFYIRTKPGQIKKVDVKTLEAELMEMMQGWEDGFANALIAEMGDQKANQIQKVFVNKIPASYKESFDTRTAVKDINRLNQLSKENPLKWHLFQSTGDKKHQLHLKLYGKNQPEVLSNVLPILENFGVAVKSADTYQFNLDDNPVWMQNYALILRNVESVDLSVVREQFENSLQQIWDNKVESDRLNELILVSKLSTFDVVVLRALSRYMIQAKAPFSHEYVVQTLTGNVDISVKLIELFHARMTPALENRESKIEAIRKEIDTCLKQVNSLDEDRIIHWLLDLINAMLRTNFYQVDESENNRNERKDRLSFKFDAHAIPNLPQPKPMFEIFVYSPRVEAVHLRGGKVARGGLRWSDRMEDFRTEVLGLVKAQMVKNSVIVPVGSKGGFIVKTDTKGMDRDAWLKEGVACYQTFIRGMLDITDNLVDGKVVAPKNTTRHDDDDPYLVVAADKGTATFSDIANALAREYGFWLDDAFASGGSVGYDHKAMGITAKGAWESVKRHFRLMGKDIQSKDTFTVVGIGDMSGDVFGNGMLLSKNIRLQAAFNHLHIFIDPKPDVAASYAERERMFALPRSNWADYDTKLISKGGGVFSRSEKSLVITDEMKQAFNISEDTLTPNQLINALLKAPVDLLWNGGIGTYVKSRDESHADVGDKANDSLRVNGCEVNAKIIGEGGNLGCTQRGRIEYAQKGGRIYTDAIDNSGGVNCSDHEVNIKILLGDVVAKGDMTVKQRNNLLESMTDEVSELVLRQNYLQPQTIELSAYEAVQRLNEHQRMMQLFESQNLLDREIELLPSDEQIAERVAAGQGLTNPELSVLLAYGKMWVYDQLLASDLPDETYFQNELRKYFPDALLANGDTPYFEQMTQHRLHREIISTYLTNGLVNRLGIETVFRLIEETGQDIVTITHAYAVARDVFNIYQTWIMLEALDNKVDAKLQIELELELRKFIKQVIIWFINNKGTSQSLDIAELTQQYQHAVQDILTDNDFVANFDMQIKASQNHYQQQGLSAEQADIFAKLPVFVKALDVVQLAQQSRKPISEVANVYLSISDQLNVGWLFAQSEQLPQQTYWDRRANNALTHEMNKTLRGLTLDVLQADDTNKAMKTWLAQKKQVLDNLQAAKESMENQPVKLSALSVLLSEMNGLHSISL